MPTVPASALHNSANARDATSWLGERSFDLLIIDYLMPDRTGLEVIRDMVAHTPSGERPAIIMMTAHGSIESAVEAMKLGAHDYLQKPFEVDELLALARPLRAAGLKAVLMGDAKQVRNLRSRRRRLLLPRKAMQRHAARPEATVSSHRRQRILRRRDDDALELLRPLELSDDRRSTVTAAAASSCSTRSSGT